jgi:hypothetical protein
MKNEQFCSKFIRQLGFRSERTFQTVLKAAGQTETTQENTPRFASAGWRPWISASERGRNCCSDIFVFIFVSTIYINKISLLFIF